MERFKYWSKSFVYSLGSHIFLLLDPAYMKSWSTMKLNLVQRKLIQFAWYIWSLFCPINKNIIYRKSWLPIAKPSLHRKLTMMKLGSVQTICPTHWKSYLVVTFPNSHVKLTKSVIISRKRDIISRRRDNISRKRDIISRKRDIISRKRINISRKRDIISRKRDIISRKRYIISRKRDIISWKRNNMNINKNA